MTSSPTTTDPAAARRTLVVLLDPLGAGERHRVPARADILARAPSLALDRLADDAAADIRVLPVHEALVQRLPALRATFVAAMARLGVEPIAGGPSLEARLARGTTTDWWLLEPSQRNPESSPVFEAVCLADLAASHLRSGRYEGLLVIGGDAETLAMYRGLAARVAVPWLDGGAVPGAPSTAGLFVKRLRALARLAAKKWIVRRFPLPAASAQGTAFHTWCPAFWVPTASGVADRCFVDVPDLVSASGHPVTFAATFDGVAPNGPAIRDAVARVEALPEAVRGRLVFVERLGTWRAWLAALLDVRPWWRVERALAGDTNWLRAATWPRDLDPSPLIARELRYAAAVQLPVFRVLQDQMRAFATRYRPARVVITMETYAYGRAVMTGLRQAPAPPRILGLQHSPGSRNQLFYWFVPEELTRTRPVPLPDAFLLHSTVIREALAGAGVPPAALHMTGAARSAGLVAHRDQRRAAWDAVRAQLGWPLDERVVVLAATIFPEETARLLSLAGRALAGPPAVGGRLVRLVIKAHPLNPDLETLVTALRRDVPGVRIDVTVTALPALLAGADVFVTGNSTSDVEALAIGCPVVRVASALIDVSPTGDVAGSVPWVTDVASLGHLLRTAPVTSGEAVVADALGPVTPDVGQRVAAAVLRA